MIGLLDDKCFSATEIFLSALKGLARRHAHGLPERRRERTTAEHRRPSSLILQTIPGHLLVGYLGQRYGDYRPDLRGGGPFFGEGWPLYWELTMYELGFHKTPEEKIGALFWRMHRCARIIFSLNFHMGLWSPQESVDFLVDRVGHERDNATA